MHTFRYLSAVAALLIAGTQGFAAEKTVTLEESGTESIEINSIADAFTHGKVKGLLRYSGQHRDSNYHVLQDAPTDTSSEKVQAYSALGGYLGYETAPYYYTSVGATFYTSNPFLGSNSDNRKGLGGLYEADGGQDSYHVLGEAFIKFQTKEHMVKVGRQEMPDYRFVSLSNIRMTPFTHEGAVYENSSIEGLKLNFAYITQQKDRNAEKFQDMVRSARVELGSGGKSKIRGDYDPANFDSDGKYAGKDKAMSMAGLIYGQDAWKVELWDYYVTDFINTFYCYGQYDFHPSDAWKVTLAGQYANQQDVGEGVAGNVDTWFYGLKAQAASDNGMLFFVSYNEIEYNEESYDGGTIFVRWGTPQMFNSFQVQDSELAGTKSIGVGAQFDLGALGILDSTVIRFRYADYDMPDNLYMTDARQDRTEATFDLRYSFTKQSGFGIFTQLDGLSIQFRLAYDQFETDYDFDAYKNLHGYDLQRVTDDFVDARLYIDYVF